MSISAITGKSSFDYLAQSVQQNKQTERQSSSSSVGEAVVLELSGTAGPGATAQGSEGGASTGSSSCPLGSNVCMGCGSCGSTSKISAGSSLTQSKADPQTSDNSNYLTTAAANAYEINSKYL